MKTRIFRTLEAYKDRQLIFNYGLEIALENIVQLNKWGIQTHTLPEWLMFIGEEVGEVNEAVAEFMYRGGDPKKIYDEAIQAATLLLKLAEFFT